MRAPQGWYSEDIDGFLVIHHGETAQSCNRGRSGVAIILSPEARAAWELGGSWVRHSSNEMTYGRSLQRHLNHFDLPTVFTEWAHLAQDRAGWHKLVTTPPFAIGKPFVRQPRGDTDSGGQALGGGAAHSRGRRTAGGLRRQQQQLRRQGNSTLAPLHTQTRTGRWNSFGPGSRFP